MSIIEIENLSYSYRDDWSKRLRSVLKNISLTINSGEAFGFLGHNGAGKTTTIKNILGFVRPSSGRILICGISNLETKSRLKLGYVPEQPYFYDYLTVHEILTMMASLCGLKHHEIKDSISQTLERVNFPKSPSTRLRSLSKGLLQRVAIAQAIIHKPNILILDEPFSGLDPVGRREIRQLFEELKAEGVTIFISSHIMSDVQQLCDRASVMVKGEIKNVYDLKTNKDLKPKGYEIICNIKDQQTLMNWQARATSWKNLGVDYSLQFDKEDYAKECLTKLVTLREEIISYSPVYSNLEELFMSHAK